MIQVYTGNGRGKTSAALGLILRMAGAGGKVCLIQFMKKGDYSEIKALKKYWRSQVALFQFGNGNFVFKGEIREEDKKEAGKGLKTAEKALKSKKYDLIVLDEINMAVYFKLIGKKEVLKLLSRWGNKKEIILTGRRAPREFIKIADLVTEMKEIKHPFKKNIRAKKGIDY